ncbi:hypothetical protein JKP88DRAFT_299835 [Tribonema minus]|uniref:Zinc finger C2H2 LYAR-type domain-containing protein n=1 Tax=Tribonema minus TaxID=303371 RepID=A0A835Z9A3_9STRA|nr:hypothetical protein JKP88DRAFT_299835 [Tribonema minus]
MVFFNCEGCNESLKKAQVEKHVFTCPARNCWAVTCIDCNVTFKGDDYATHTTCISEAEKYEKTVYKGNKGKPVKKNPQDAWMDLVTEAAASAATPPAVRAHLQRMADFGNVPRQEKKFRNFLQNSLKLWDAGAIDAIWRHLEALRAAQRQAGDAAAAAPLPAAAAAEVADGPPAVVAESHDGAAAAAAQGDGRPAATAGAVKKRRRDAAAEGVAADSEATSGAAANGAGAACAGKAKKRRRAAEGGAEGAAAAEAAGGGADAHANGGGGGNSSGAADGGDATEGAQNGAGGNGSASSDTPDLARAAKRALKAAPGGCMSVKALGKAVAAAAAAAGGGGGASKKEAKALFKRALAAGVRGVTVEGDMARLNKAKPPKQ